VSLAAAASRASVTLPQGVPPPLAERASDLGIEWDAENRLLAVKQGGSPLASFTYDGAGRRATKTANGVTTSYVYDGVQFLEERPSAGASKRYVYGPGIDNAFAQVVGGTASYNVADHLGSLVGTTDAAGNLTLAREYDPWGNPLQGATTTGYAFTGREWDSETGLYYYRARYYDPKVGRFIRTDPAQNADSVGDYVYTRNNPVGRRDPTGLKTIVLFPEFHASVHVDNSKDPLLYDPAGGYIPPGAKYHYSDILGGDDAQIGPYIWWHEAIDKRPTHVYTFCTTPSEESEIATRILAQPTVVSGGLCASQVQRVIAGVGPFKNIPQPSGSYVFPSTLEDLVIKAASGK
jgi:RHS repeat-associated protein